MARTFMVVASRLAIDRDKERVLDELEAFASELSATCNVLREPENPGFFIEVQDLPWQLGDEGTETVRNQSAEYMKNAMLEHLMKDGQWNTLREDSRFRAIIEKVAPEQSKEDE